MALQKLLCQGGAQDAEGCQWWEVGEGRGAAGSRARLGLAEPGAGELPSLVLLLGEDEKAEVAVMK